MRLRPYTVRGIQRVPCVRCGAPSAYQWQVCADGRQFRAICASCDLLMNEMVMRWMFTPIGSIKTPPWVVRTLKAYRRRILSQGER